MKKLRVDYHFHPRLPKKNHQKANHKAKKWWQQFEENNINCLIVTEHVYLNPKRAFAIMNQNKPKGSFCFPGLEYVTKEGIDIVIFSHNPDIYKIPELKPFKLNYEQTINLILSRKDLFSFVTHPYTMGLTSVLRKLGYEKYIKFVHDLGAVEITHCVYDNCELLLKKFPLNLIFRRLLKKIDCRKHLPESDYPEKINFLAAGSDAHHVSEVGNCYELNLLEKLYSQKEIFTEITNNKGAGETVIKDAELKVFLLFISWLRTEYEYFMKVKFRVRAWATVEYL